MKARLLDRDRKLIGELELNSKSVEVLVAYDARLAKTGEATRVFVRDDGAKTVLKDGSEVFNFYEAKHAHISHPSIYQSLKEYPVS